MSATHDPIVIYYSAEDGCWLAHSLETDQIGDGESVLEALENLMRGLVAIHANAAADSTLRVWRKAPEEIIAIAKAAKPLPAEIFETACKRVHGKWPSELMPNFDADDTAGPFATAADDLVAA